MKSIQFLIVLFLTMTILSCDNGKLKLDKDHTIRNIDSTELNAETQKIHDIKELLEIALVKDSIELENYEPFLFFKSGIFQNSNQKEAFIITASSDSTDMVKYYTLHNKKWILNDSIDGLESISQFKTTFKDFNFDNQVDIYIQVTASNGYSLSFGHLLIIDPLNKKITEHKEARNLANMKPELASKTVFSEDIIYCSKQATRGICKWENKWINGSLKTTRKNCPCIEN